MQMSITLVPKSCQAVPRIKQEPRMTDRRKDTREKMTAFTPVYDAHPRTLLGYLADLTLHGVRVTGEHPVEVDRRGTLSIEFLHPLPDITSTPLTIPARVARCTQDDVNPKYYDIGFEFTEVQPEQTKIVEAILRRYHF